MRHCSCLSVARMSRPSISTMMDEYQDAVDEIVAACRGDLHRAVRALLLINEQLERKLQRLSAVIENADDQLQPVLH